MPNLRLGDNEVETIFKYLLEQESKIKITEK
jgi:hypothetical protein